MALPAGTWAAVPPAGMWAAVPPVEPVPVPVLMPAPLLLNMLMNSFFVGKNRSCLGRMPTNIFIEERLQSIPVLIDKQGLDKTIYAGVNKGRGGFHRTSPFAVSGIMERGGSDKLSLHRFDIERK